MNRHPWQQARDAEEKLKAARKEAHRRRARKYRAENLEERRMLERHYHRKRLGLPLEAPKMAPWEHAKKQIENRDTP